MTSPPLASCVLATAIVLALTSGSVCSGTPWVPSPASAPNVANEIARHVGPRYRVSATGAQLASVRASKLIHIGTMNHKVWYTVVRKKPNSNVGIAIYLTKHESMYTLCGRGPHCVVAAGLSTEKVDRLVHREVLELALDTFRYSPTTAGVLVMLPPERDLPLPLVVHFRRSTLTATPKAAAIDKLVESHTHWATYDALQVIPGGIALVLNPTP